MNSIKNIIVATTLSAILSVAHLATAQAADDVQTLKPLQAISFHAGSKDTVAYFLSENATCKLVLTTADQVAQSTRIEAAISGGASNSYELTEGTSLEFACQAGGLAMNVRSLEAVASETPNISPGTNWARAGLGG
jgi:hypothetical protein